MTARHINRILILFHNFSTQNPLAASKVSICHSERRLSKIFQVIHRSRMLNWISVTIDNGYIIDCEMVFVYNRDDDYVSATKCIVHRKWLHIKSMTQKRDARHIFIFFLCSLFWYVCN